MIKCNLCKRITEKGKSTGLFIEYYKWEDHKGIIHKDIHSTIKCCMNCRGSCLLK